MNLQNYPNIEMALAGAVSGKVTEWPQLRVELRKLIQNYDDLLAKRGMQP